MQILITKLRLISCIIFFTYTGLCSAAENFNEYFQIKSEIDTAIANRVTYYFSENVELSAAQQEAELLKLESRLNAIEPAHTELAIYWFIRGLNDRNIAAFYTHSNNQEQANKYIQNKNNAYEKALQLTSKNPLKLNAVVYNTMKHGLPEDLKIQATQFELAQGGNADNESEYWYLHWSNIDQLKKAGRHVEADKAFQEMQKAMQENKADMSVYVDLNNQIEKQTFDISEKETLPSPKGEEADENQLASKEVVIPALLMTSLLSLLLVIIYEFFIKKRKNKHTPN